MQLIKDNRTGKVYKTNYPIENDTLSHLHGYAFVKAGALTEAETLSPMKCLEKWPFIEILGNVDGRTAGAKQHKYFTWLVVVDEK